MREIKFRVWRAYYLEMVYDLKGVYQVLGEFMQFGMNTFVGGTEDVLMQYTGLKDKNGVEIYEGDILKDEYSLLTKVEWWDCGTWGQEPIPYENFMDYWQYATNHDDVSLKEVIGNIYENKELINERD